MTRRTGASREGTGPRVDRSRSSHKQSRKQFNSTLPARTSFLRSSPPVSRSTPERTPVPRGNPARKAASFARCYGSIARVEFVKALPSVWDGAGPCVNAHVGRKGAGARRKADADQIVPLTDAQHKAFDQHRAPFDTEASRAAVRACMADVERAWLAAARGGTQERGAEDHDELRVERSLVCGGGFDERGVHVGGQADHKADGFHLLAGHGTKVRDTIAVSQD
jgi:hypothetical protein